MQPIIELRKLAVVIDNELDSFKSRGASHSAESEALATSIQSDKAKPRAGIAVTGWTEAKV